MRISKMIKPMVFLGVFCAVNMLLSFLIEPAQGSSDTMWEEYYQEAELDMVFVGSSLCSATFDPKIFDEQMGVTSFNLGTPMQAIGQNISGLRTAFEEHDIKTVVIGMGFFVLQEEAVVDAELTYERALARAKGGWKGFLESMEYIFSEDVRGTEKSINYWFPWQYDREEYSWDIIYRNVRTKLNMMSGSYEKEASTKGYRPYDGYLEYEKLWNTNSYYTYEQELKTEQLALFEEMLVLCKENGADVIVVNTPHPALDVISCYDVYAQNDNVIRELCQTYGVDYYNFSLAKESVYEGKIENYYDYEHLNYEGSQEFCRMLSEFLMRRAAGDDMKDCFYTVEEFLAIHEELLEEYKNVRL